MTTLLYGLDQLREEIGGVKKLQFFSEEEPTDEE
jgi:hypothetical protein